MAQELEIKLSLMESHIPGAVDWLLAGAKARDQGQRLLVNRYYDTPGGDLNGRKIALRVRQKGNRFIQTLKTQGEFVDGAHCRQEWEWELPGPDLKLGLLADTPVGQGINLTELSPVFETNFTRRTLLIEEGDTLIEVAVDSGQVLAGNRSRPLNEVEFELKSGDPAALMRWAMKLAKQVPVFLNLVSKAELGYYLADLYAPAASDLAVDTPWTEMALLAALSRAWLTGRKLRLESVSLKNVCKTAESAGMKDACHWLCQQLGQGADISVLAQDPALGQLQLALARG